MTTKKRKFKIYHKLDKDNSEAGDTVPEIFYSLTELREFEAYLKESNIEFASFEVLGEVGIIEEKLLLL